MINYGLPYQGSKSAIAPWVVSCLPPGDTLVDLFCGGCAVTDAAMRAHRYKHFIINDISPMMPMTFVKALKGGFRGEDRWIDRETFFRLKDTDPYAALCFSFSNNRKDYAYGKPVEPYKKALHYAIVFDDWDPLKELCPDVIDAAYSALNGVSDRYERRLRCFAVIRRQLKKMRFADLYLKSFEPSKTSKALKALKDLKDSNAFKDSKASILKLIMKIIAKCLFRTVPLSIVIRLIKERANIYATSIPIPSTTGRSRVTTQFSSQSMRCRMSLRRLLLSKRHAL